MLPDLLVGFQQIYNIVFLGICMFVDSTGGVPQPNVIEVRPSQVNVFVIICNLCKLVACKRLPGNINLQHVWVGIGPFSVNDHYHYIFRGIKTLSELELSKSLKTSFAALMDEASPKFCTLAFDMVLQETALALIVSTME